MPKLNDNYSNILAGLKEFEFILNQLELENKECENINVILNSQIAGIAQERINIKIKTFDLNDIEREDLLNQFDELKDYFADIQVGFELGCKCIKTTEKERDEIYERHNKMVMKREGIDYIKKAYGTAILQLMEEEIREKGR